ncbi:hypothetical protein FA15DRAFT_671854 [Coprinopsis marcescibilis]|uniref:GST N-terminal domain-containing protein n=1 Tax=Coprinopsis marcescibilis TaxID=230819 RepID=A0A5C3KQN8_COPMA|nr:hypothetical protein FA15DRAFT_671854 [Coprinopsis marcescibilis]
MITFYDFLCPPPQVTKSGNTWKTRLTLNYKGLPYKTENIEYAEIADLYKKHGIPPAIVFPNGHAHYTLPVIKDDSSGKDVFVVDSLEIAKYLDKTYPNTPRLIPDVEDAEAQIKAFENQMNGTFVSVMPVMFKASLSSITERSQEFFKAARVRDMNFIFPHKPVSSWDDIQFTPEEVQAAWASLEKPLDALSNRFGGKETFHWALGDQITSADLILAGLLLCVKAVNGEDSPQWQSIMTWSNGKWKTFLDKLEPYQSQEN